MKVVIDGMCAEPGASAVVIIEHLVRGWSELGTDEIHLLLHPDTTIPIPDGVIVEPTHFGKWAGVGRLKTQTFDIPRLCRRIGADAVVGLIPSTTVSPLPCVRAVITHDVRWEILPDQYPTRTRIIRRVSYAIGWRQADAIGCITERTRQDLLRPRPYLRNRRVGLTYYGSDHVAGWEQYADHSGEPYAVAFGQYGNKNAPMVVDAWAVLRDRGEAMPLKLIAVPAAVRQDTEDHIARLGLGDLITPSGWLSGDELKRCFASAAMFVFPTSFEGFGLPAIEAMRLSIPLVISPEPAVMEISGGLATVMKDYTAADLADAVVKARSTSAEDLARARERALGFTWAGMAAAIRALLEDARAERS